MFRLTLAFLSLLSTLDAVICGKPSDPESVKTDSGWVKGITRDSTYGKNGGYITFFGIPYAEPPVKHLRFKPPVYIRPWESIISNRDFQPSCPPQTFITPRDVNANESCLYLNIFKPVNIDKKKKPCVMVYFHGGVFTEGGSRSYDPEFLLDQGDVIFVSINYRLGILGFLNLNNKDAPGNMGLLDQQLALKWIHTNIEKFGGDKTKICLFGFSAGASSINFHVLNAESRKYFSNCILQSGTALSQFSLTIDVDGHYGRLQKYIEKNIETKLMPFDQLLSKYVTNHTWNISEILESTRTSGTIGRSLGTIWSPVIEAKGNSVFMSDHPEQLYKDQAQKIDKNILFGVTNAEYLPFYGMFIATHQDFANTAKDYCKLKLPLRQYNITLNMPEFRGLGERMFNHFFKKSTEHIVPTDQYAYLQLLSEFYISNDIARTVKLHAKTKGKAYYYRFSGSSTLNFYHGARQKLFTNIPSNIPIAGHSDDLCYIFKCRGRVMTDIYSGIFNGTQPKLRDLMESLLKMFVNFAKTGVPQVGERKFKPASETAFQPIEITNDGILDDDETSQLLYEVSKQAEDIAKITARKKF